MTFHPAMVLTAVWTGAPLDYFFHAFGPNARQNQMLGWVFAGISVAVCVLIAVLLFLGMARSRPAGQGVVKGNPAAVRWVAIASGLSVVVLFGMAVYALVTLQSVAAPNKTPALEITVTGYDWWWRADYGTFETANEIHIPTGQPVLIKLNSADVIHAFWVPQLAGKTQMIPGILNRQWIQADRPGIYRGQCTQFCGLQHAHMAFEVVAEDPVAFERWRRNQASAAAPPGNPEQARGQALFLERCGGCHAVRGTPATGGHAPDLTHLISRRQIAAGLMDTTPLNIGEWVEHAQTLKPGSRMPSFSLSDRERNQLLAYLMVLK